MRLFRLLFALLLAAFPALASDTPYPTRAPLTAQPAAKVEAHPALWVVQGKSGTAYLLGSIHILPANIAWHTPQIDAAMNAADTFVFEVPTDDTAMATMRTFIEAHGTLPAAKPFLRCCRRRRSPITTTFSPKRRSRPPTSPTRSPGSPPSSCRSPR